MDYLRLAILFISDTNDMYLFKIMIKPNYKLRIVMMESAYGQPLLGQNPYQPHL